MTGQVEPDDSLHRLILDKQGKRILLGNGIDKFEEQSKPGRYNSQVFGKPNYEMTYSDSEGEEITLLEDYSNVNESDKYIDMSPGER
jgi:hypothetical protein